MNRLLALVRTVGALFVLLFGAIAVLLVSVVPLRLQGRRPAAWITVGLARIFCLLYNVRVNCHNRDEVVRHRGFIFANHQSYLDSIALLSIMPVRFLAAAEVRAYPLVGWVAQAIGTIFVKRDSRDSRQQVRVAIANAFQREPDPPLVLFPEGKLGDPEQLLPFRYGAFEMASAQQMPYLLCAIRYRPSTVAVWRGGAGEKLAAAVWKLALHLGPLQVEILPCATVQIDSDSSPADLAQSAQQIIAAALRRSASDCQQEVIIS